MALINLESCASLLICSPCCLTPQHRKYPQMLSAGRNIESNTSPTRVTTWYGPNKVWQGAWHHGILLPRTHYTFYTFRHTAAHPRLFSLHDAYYFVYRRVVTYKWIRSHGISLKIKSLKTKLLRYHMRYQCHIVVLLYINTCKNRSQLLWTRSICNFILFLWQCWYQSKT